MKKKTRQLFLSSVLMLSGLALVGCGEKPSESTKPVETTPETTKPVDSTVEEVKVQEIKLTLSKDKARIGDLVEASLTFKPSNATNKEFTLSSSDETIATITADNKIQCVARGQVTITARSTANPLKKSEATLTILGTDEQGRSENIFEAEEATIVASEGSGIKVETTSDDRVSNGAVVGSLSKGDRIVWGVNSSETEENAELHFRLMGPSGWGGLWNSIAYTFADWFTIKVNGKIVDTENVFVEGTYLDGGSADYYNMGDVTIGNINLIQGLNTITFAISNRYDVSYYTDDHYAGYISCIGNIDLMTIYSTKELSFVAGTTEVENADPDVKLNKTVLEAEAETTRVYKDADNPKVDLGDKTYAEFSEGMNIMFGVTSDKAIKAKLTLKIAAPYVSASSAASDVALADIASFNIGGKNVSLDGLTLLGNGTTGDKQNYTTIQTGWIELAAGDNVLALVIKKDLGFEYLGALDYLEIDYVDANLTPFLNEAPTPEETFVFEAEASTTKRVGFDALEDNATYVEMKDPVQVQSDRYNDKTETKKVIFGMEAAAESYATISITMSTPYIDATTPMVDTSIGSLGDLWVNGTLVSTPNILSGNNAVGVKDNFTTVTIEEQVKLNPGKNRIAWEPCNYTDNSYAFLGALDKIEVTTSTSLTPYEVNMWTDRNTYFDSTGGEPIYVTVDKVSESNPNNCWVGLWHADDPIEENAVGSLYWYYPTNATYNSDKNAYLGTPCDITKQNPNSERHLIDGLPQGQGDYSSNDKDGYGFFTVVYMEWDSRNGSYGYDITDQVYISVWNDPDVYGGYVQA